MLDIGYSCFVCVSVFVCVSHVCVFLYTTTGGKEIAYCSFDKKEKAATLQSGRLGLIGLSLHTC